MLPQLSLALVLVYPASAAVLPFPLALVKAKFPKWLTHQSCVVVSTRVGDGARRSLVERLGTGTAGALRGGPFMSSAHAAWGLLVEI